MPAQTQPTWNERASRPIKPQSRTVTYVKLYDPSKHGNILGLGGGVAKQLSDLPGFGQDLPSGFSEAISTIRIYEQSTGSYVNFSVSPDISENKSTNYIEVSDIRKPASLMIFMASPSRTFSLSAKLISRTSEEALKNFRDLNLMKSWAMPDNSTDGVGIGGEFIQNLSPTILYLYGYGSIFKGIQVVLKNLDIDYPSECDYIPLVKNGGKTKMPVVLNVKMSLQEIRSSEELQNFNLEQYKLGRMAYW